MALIDDLRLTFVDLHGLTRVRLLQVVRFLSAVTCLLLLQTGSSWASSPPPTRLHDPPPQVTALFPNGGELLIEGSVVQLSWSASGGTGALPIDLYLSTDYGGSYQSIATSVLNTGAYDWEANLATNADCQDPVYSALLKVVARSADGTSGEDVSDSPFGIFHITECHAPPCCVVSPTVSVIKPNGPADDLLVGSDTHLQWWASGSYSAELTGIDLYMSKDLGASYQLIASGLDNTGDYLWHVDPAFATNSGLAGVDSALFMVVAHDQIGREGHDVSDAPFSIDGAVPTRLSVLRASAIAGGVELRWQFDDPTPVSAVTVERAAKANGPWNPLNVDVRRDGEWSVALDRGGTMGQTYYYRIQVTWVSGQAGVYGPVSASVGEAIANTELDRVGPTPSAGQPVRIEYSVARGGGVCMSVVDLQGRLVAELRAGVQPPGRYEVIWNPRADVPSGIYFVRYEAAGHRMSRRIVVTN